MTPAAASYSKEYIEMTYCFLTQRFTRQHRVAGGHSGRFAESSTCVVDSAPFSQHRSHERVDFVIL